MSRRLYRALLLAVVFPSGLILANTRATFEAFFSTRMDFNRTTRVGEIHAGGWRGGPELVVGRCCCRSSPSPNPNWSALFFFFAVSGSGLDRGHGRIGTGAAGPPAHHARRVAASIIGASWLTIRNQIHKFESRLTAAFGHAGR